MAPAGQSDGLLEVGRADILFTGSGTDAHAMDDHQCEDLPGDPRLKIVCSLKCQFVCSSWHTLAGISIQEQQR